MSFIFHTLIPFMLLLTLYTNVNGDNNNASPPFPHWWTLLEEKLSGIMTKVSENEVQNRRLQSTISKVSAAEAHLAALRSEIKEKDKITIEKLDNIPSKELLENQTAVILSKVSGIRQSLETKVNETKEINAALENIQTGLNCATGNFVPSLANAVPKDCSNYDASKEFQLPFSSSRNADTFCKVCLYGKEYVGKGDNNGCFVSVAGSEIYIGYGHYLLRKPSGVNLTHISGNEALAGAKDWKGTEKILVEKNAINFFSIGPKGYAGACNAGIVGNMPGDGGGNWPHNGILYPTFPPRLMYTYGGRTYPCENFSLLTCVNK